MNHLIEFFEKLITQFSWQRFAFVLIVSFFFIAGFVVYETYTGHFRFNRIERATTLLKELTALSPEIKETGNADLAEVFKGLTKDLNASVNHSLPPFSLPTWALKALAATAPWVFFAILLLLTGVNETKSAIQGIVVGAVPCIIIGALLPDFEYTPYNYVAYPIGSTVIVIAVAMILSKWQKK